MISLYFLFLFADRDQKRFCFPSINQVETQTIELYSEEQSCISTPTDSGIELQYTPNYKGNHEIISDNVFHPHIQEQPSSDDSGVSSFLSSVSQGTPPEYAQIVHKPSSKQLVVVNTVCGNYWAKSNDFTNKPYFSNIIN